MFLSLSKNQLKNKHIIAGSIEHVHETPLGEDIWVFVCLLLCISLHTTCPLPDFSLYPFIGINHNHECNSFFLHRPGPFSEVKCKMAAQSLNQPSNKEIEETNFILILFSNWRLKAHPSWSSFRKWCFNQAQWYFPSYLSTTVNRFPHPEKGLIPRTHPHSSVNIQILHVVSLSYSMGACAFTVSLSLCRPLQFNAIHCPVLDKQQPLLIGTEKALQTK